MTTVLGIALDGVVFMAADTGSNVYERPIVNAVRKIRLVDLRRGQILLGVTGHGGLPDVLTASLNSTDTPALRRTAAPGNQADAQAWAHAVAAAVTDLAVGAGFVEGGQMAGSVLLGYDGRLWTLCHNTAIPHPDGVAAVGSGEGPAMGAADAYLQMHAANRLGRFAHPQGAGRWIVDAAVRIAVARDKHSALPVQVQTLPWSPAYADDDLLLGAAQLSTDNTVAA